MSRGKIQTGRREGRQQVLRESYGMYEIMYFCFCSEDLVLRGLYPLPLICV